MPFHGPKIRSTCFERAQPDNGVHVFPGDSIMKHKMLALILALTVASWAQTATQTTPSTPPQNTESGEKAKCACCDKMKSSDMKAHDDAKGHSCCAHHAKKGSEAKEGESCCGGKDAKTCMRADKSSGSCCKDGCGKDEKSASSSCCKECGKECCGAKKDTTAKTNCCRHGMHG
jgi:hypothetical protein